LKNINFKR